VVQLSEDEVIAIDGKAMRGTFPNGETQGIHLLSAYLPREGVVLHQTEVENKENEISTAPRLLAKVNVRGKVVIGDALHTQRKTSIAVVEEQDDYLWIAKENQSDLRANIAPPDIRPVLSRRFSPASRQWRGGLFLGTANCPSNGTFHPSLTDTKLRYKSHLCFSKNPFF
jgi:hypothetical protein